VIRDHLPALGHGGMDPAPAPIVSPPLTLLQGEFRARGYHLIDAIAVHLSAPGTFPPVPPRVEMDQLLAEPLPRGEADPAEVFDRLLQAVVAKRLPLDHPRFLAFVPGPSNPIGVLADLAATGSTSSGAPGSRPQAPLRPNYRPWAGCVRFSVCRPHPRGSSCREGRRPTSLRWGWRGIARPIGGVASCTAPIRIIRRSRRHATFWGCASLSRGACRRTRDFEEPLPTL
jgi:hypothetical protein